MSGVTIVTSIVNVVDELDARIVEWTPLDQGLHRTVVGPAPDQSGVEGFRPCHVSHRDGGVEALDFHVLLLQWVNSWMHSYEMSVTQSRRGRARWHQCRGMRT